MASMIRALKAALATMVLWPMIGNAVPIFQPPTGFHAGISGWANGSGNFVVDWGGAYLATGSQASYTTASSLFSATSSLIAFSGGATPFALRPGDMRLDAIVRETGTISGDLIAGILTVRAGVDGVPQAGIAAGETLVVGHAIDAAALGNDPFNVLFLFGLTYTHSAFSSLGSYVTYQGPYAGAWNTGIVNGAFVSRPWGVDWENTGGFTLSSFVQTHALPEPGTLALLSFGLVGLAVIRRRKQ